MSTVAPVSIGDECVGVAIEPHKRFPLPVS